MQKKREEKEYEGIKVNTGEGQETKDKYHYGKEEKQVVDDKNEIQNEEHVVEGKNKNNNKIIQSKWHNENTKKKKKKPVKQCLPLSSMTILVLPPVSGTVY